MSTASSQPAPRARRSPHRWVPALALFVAVAASNAHAQQPLTLDQALHLAQQRSHHLVAQEAAVTAAREMSAAAGQLPDPTLKEIGRAHV